MELKFMKGPFQKSSSGSALSLAYVQLFSMNQVSRLGELAKYHPQPRQRQKSQKAAMEKLFGDDDVLNFDGT